MDEAWVLMLRAGELDVSVVDPVLLDRVMPASDEVTDGDDPPPSSRIGAGGATIGNAADLPSPLRIETLNEFVGACFIPPGSERWAGCVDARR